MTRPMMASRAFVDSLPEALADCVDAILTPLLRIEPTGVDVSLAPSDAVIFSSGNGVRFAPDGAGRVAYCVGPATTRAALDRGWAARQSGDTAEALAHELVQNPLDQRLIHLSGTHTRGDILGRLRAAGADVHRVALYDQQTCDLTDAARRALGGDRPVLVPLFSPRTATHFFAQLPALERAVLLGLSDTVAACAPDQLRETVIVSAAPNAPAMIKALQETVDRLASG
ncbi:MAG: uroporphyrinogen-III synthase [Pseudomonadota bacterium]